MAFWKQPVLNAGKRLVASFERLCQTPKKLRAMLHVNAAGV
jgi:hypothetical protein